MEKWNIIFHRTKILSFYVTMCPASLSMYQVRIIGRCRCIDVKERLLKNVPLERRLRINNLTKNNWSGNLMNANAFTWVRQLSEILTSVLTICNLKFKFYSILIYFSHIFWYLVYFNHNRVIFVLNDKALTCYVSDRSYFSSQRCISCSLYREREMKKLNECRDMGLKESILTLVNIKCHNYCNNDKIEQLSYSDMRGCRRSLKCRIWSSNVTIMTLSVGYAM